MSTAQERNKAFVEALEVTHPEVHKHVEAYTADVIECVLSIADVLGQVARQDEELPPEVTEFSAILLDNFTRQIRQIVSTNGAVWLTTHR